MHKIVIHRAGHYDQLRYERCSAPPLPRGHVRIEVAAAGVNYADCIVRMGLYSSAKEYVGWPITPGFEVGGRVIEVAPDVQGVAVGDEVFAVTRFDGYADELVVPAGQVFARPAGWTAVEAAAMPAVSLTAWHALELSRPPAGAAVLVHSAAGGVGQALVQLALHRGCRVVGVVGSSHKVDAVRSLGAHDVVDKSAPGDAWAKIRRAAPLGYGAVFDANGVATLGRSYEVLAPTGILVVYGFATMLPRAGRRVSWLRLAYNLLRTPRFAPLHLTTHNHGVIGFNLSYLFGREDLLTEGMNALTDAIERGVLRKPTVETFPLARVGQAHAAIESGRTVGKLVLTTDHARSEPT